jgi:hypothetical protein
MSAEDTAAVTAAPVGDVGEAVWLQPAAAVRLAASTPAQAQALTMVDIWRLLERVRRPAPRRSAGSLTVVAERAEI